MIDHGDAATVPSKGTGEHIPYICQLSVLHVGHTLTAESYQSRQSKAKSFKRYERICSATAELVDGGYEAC